jgi:hydrogenase nickel incorporation protein HypA/HybF
MHELGIVFHIIKSVEEIGKKEDLSRVESVTLEIGKVSGVIPSYLTDCWEWAVNRSDLMRGADLKVEEIPAVTHCENCKKEYDTISYGRTCPHCGSAETYLLQGDEVNIKEIEAC